MLPVLIAADWSLHYERSGFVETGRFDEAVAYCRRLDAASPHAKVIEYGTSPQGRKMVALVISREKDPTKSSKPLIFVQNGIHSGEIEGKDASLILARDMLITGKREELLDRANWVIVPILSVDGHERFGPYNRINQNGPREMGWRSTAQNLNLNRDWMKADAPEMQAQVRLVHRYRPDFFFDNHTTDGADYPYVLTLSLPSGPALPTATAEWQRRLYATIKPQTDRDGFLTSPYLSLVDRTDPSKGLLVDDYGPRFSHGYVATLNRPSMLVETHVLKPYRQRVEATYSVMVRTAEFCIKNATELKSMNANADAAERAGLGRVVLTSERSRTTRPFTFLSHPYTPVPSTAAGAPVAKWDRSRIVPVETTISDAFVPGVVVDLPKAYAVPPEWSEVIDRLKLHGLKFSRLKQPVVSEFETYRFDKVTFPNVPFEGRLLPRYQAEKVREPRALPAGTYVFPVNQVGGRLLANLLEPEAPDSLVRWGLFNNVFESKEYAEDYAMAPEADAMLARDPKLRAEFEKRLKDETFAKNPRARLQWFYERSPWFDQRLNRYPVVRL